MSEGLGQPRDEGAAGAARWEHFAHDADVGVRGIGPTRAAAFEQAALALFHVAGEVDRVAAREVVEVSCAAPDDEVLLVDWLNALVFEMATRGMLLARTRVRIDDHRLTGRAFGEAVDLDRHVPGVEVKGATYTALAVRRRADGSWLAQCVVDV